MTIKEQKVEPTSVSGNSTKPRVMRRFPSLKSQLNGWVIICINHPRTGTDYIVNSTFSYTRREAIKSFVNGSGSDWKYWKYKYNFKAVKAAQSVSVLNDA